MLKRVAAVAGLLLAVFAFLVPLRAEIIEQVLVKVNGEILTKTEFEQRQVAVLRTRPELANASEISDELRRAVAEITPQLILDTVDELLLIQRGREMGMALGDEQFRSVLENIRKQNALEDEERFQAALQQEGMTLADLRRNIERSMLIQQSVQRDVIDKITVTEDEARTYYDSHKQEFTTPSEVTLREILVAVPQSERGINVAQDDAAREKAEAIRQRLVAGEPFARLAAELSEAPSKANGGLIGPISRDELSPTLQAQLTQMNVGDVTEVTRTPTGYQLLKLESRTESKVRSFEDAREDITNKIGEQKMEAERFKYLDKLRLQATITWRNDELKRAYEQALAARQKALAG